MSTENNFEQQLLELENIIKKLESNQLTLDESLAEYKNGIGLIKNCNSIIEKAEEEVAKLSKDLAKNE